MGMLLAGAREVAAVALPAPEVELEPELVTLDLEGEFERRQIGIVGTNDCGSSPFEPVCSSSWKVRAPGVFAVLGAAWGVASARMGGITEALALGLSLNLL
jgi:hypothetical protein